MLERCQTQSQSPQMLYESGERKGSSLDRGWSRVPSTPPSERLLSRVRLSRLSQVLYISCNFNFQPLSQSGWLRSASLSHNLTVISSVSSVLSFNLQTQLSPQWLHLTRFLYLGYFYQPACSDSHLTSVYILLSLLSLLTNHHLHHLWSVLHDDGPGLDVNWCPTVDIKTWPLLVQYRTLIKLLNHTMARDFDKLWYLHFTFYNYQHHSKYWRILFWLMISKCT